MSDTKSVKDPETLLAIGFILILLPYLLMFANIFTYSITQTASIEQVDVTGKAGYEGMRSAYLLLWTDTGVSNLSMLRIDKYVGATYEREYFLKSNILVDQGGIKLILEGIENPQELILFPSRLLDTANITIEGIQDAIYEHNYLELRLDVNKYPDGQSLLDLVFLTIFATGSVAAVHMVNRTELYNDTSLYPRYESGSSHHQVQDTTKMRPILRILIMAPSVIFTVFVLLSIRPSSSERFQQYLSLVLTVTSPLVATSLLGYFYVRSCKELPQLLPPVIVVYTTIAVFFIGGPKYFANSNAVQILAAIMAFIASMNVARGRETRRIVGSAFVSAHIFVALLFVVFTSI